ncbi:MAG: type VII secretion protein EssC [Clostridiales bacterium]|nr:type VII secretion protein EssC [Clostridiales bacterium]
MSWLRINCAANGRTISYPLDTEKHGTHTLFPPGCDASMRIVVGENGVHIDGAANYRIGGSLAPGSYAEVRLGETSAIVTSTDTENGYEMYDIAGKDAISVGCSANHDIVYTLESKISLSQEPYLKIHKEHSETNRAYIENLSRMDIVYVNGILAGKTAAFNFGDEISLLGLSIVCLGAEIAVSNPMGFTRVNLRKSDPVKRIYADQRAETIFKRTTRIYSAPKIEKYVIEQPAQPNVTQKLPAALTIGPMVTMAVSTAASLSISVASSGANIASMVMAGSMLAGMLVWPAVSRRYERSAEKRAETLRISRYENYLTYTEEKIAANIKANLIVLNSSGASSTNVIEWIDNNALRRVWERSYYDSDFLSLRLGVGRIQNPSAIEAPRPNYLNVGDPLMEKAGALQEKYRNIDGAPFALDLKKSNSVGIIGMKALSRALAVSMAVQLAALHDSAELKLAFVVDSTVKSDFDWIKKLPHTWNDDMNFRYIAQTKTEAAALFRNLLEELGGRNTVSGALTVPAYVLFIIDKDLIEDVSVSGFVAADFAKTGFASIYAFEDMEDIPSGCKSVIQVLADRTALYDRASARQGFQPFEKEIVSPVTAAKFGGVMSLFRTGTGRKNMGIPASLTFMDLFRVGKVEDINITHRWNTAAPQKSLAVPIGIKGGGDYFYLDIHEKAHGSHGLMAGTTGSGKSECIQAIILSLAVHFHPDDVCFVLIDFKGGGMANLFTGIPHLSGTITNLGNQIRRSMISLDAELSKRQRMLKEAGVNHIDKYQKLYKEGKVQEPMPHMALISDEFAELKAQQPDFMEKLKSAARIGRSLGVHLILATQKPSGVVDDQIWSNTRFRICLKVADKTDSNGMIDSPLAAAITLPGRAYVQVGYNEVFEQVQTAYTGADYIPTEEYINRETREVQRVDSCGQITAQASIAAKAVQTREKLNQLEAVVKYIEQVSLENNIKPRPIWQDPLPRILAREECDKYAEKTGMSITVGLIDDPELQVFHAMEVPLTKAHIALYGMPGCGKTTFVQTLLFEAALRYKTDEVQFLIVDFGGRSLEIFQSAPHTRRVLTPADNDDIILFLQDLTDEIELRREKFALRRQESLDRYNQVSGERLPVVLVVVDSYGKFADEAQDANEILTGIIKEGAKYGVIVLLTANTVNAISYKYSDYFSQKYTLQLGDAIDYATVVGSTMGMFPEQVKGRGLVRYDGRVIEYQTALCINETDDGERSRKISEALTGIAPSGQSTHADVKPAKQIEPKPTVSVTRAAQAPAKPAKTGGLGGIPGLRGISPKPRANSAGAKKKSKLTDFAQSGEAPGLTVALNRVNGEEYVLPMGKSMYMLSSGGIESAMTANIARKATARGITTFYCGADSPFEKAYNSDSEISEMIVRLEGGGLVVIEDLMKFYQAVSDADLDKFVEILQAGKNISLIAAAQLKDAQILKDYPLGILLFKKWKTGMLLSGKTIDCATVLPSELLTTQTFDERNALATPRSPLLFQPDGAFEKIAPVQ